MSPIHRNEVGADERGRKPPYMRFKNKISILIILNILYVHNTHTNSLVYLMRKTPHSIRIQLLILICLIVFQCIHLPLFPNGNASNEAIQNKNRGYDDEILINKTFGGLRDDRGKYVQETSDKGYILIGQTGSNGAGGFDIWVIKTDDDGNIIWDKTYGGPKNEEGVVIQETNDNGFIIAGITSSIGNGDRDIWLIKIDIDGNIIWDKTFGGDKWDVPDSILLLEDGSYIILASTESFGAGDFNVWLIKADSNGNEIWNHTFGGDDYDAGNWIQHTNDGGYMLACTSSLNEDCNPDILIIKTDANGNELWNKRFGGTGSEGSSMIESKEGGFVIVGYKTVSIFGRDVWLIEIDEDGNEMWNQTYGASSEEWGYFLQITDNGDIIIVGHSWYFEYKQYDIWLIKTDKNGNQKWNRLFGGDKYDRGYCLCKTSAGNYLIIGSTASFGNGNDFHDIWLLKINASAIQDGTYDVILHGDPPSNGDVHPNGGSNGNGSENGKDGNGDNSKTTSEFPYLWIAIGAGAVILIAIIIIIIRRRNEDDEWDDDDEEDEEDEDEEEDDRSILLGKKGKVAPLPQKRCVKCNTILITPDAAFCAACGSSQAAVSAPAPSPQTINCPGCGGVNPHGTAFCGMCGMNLQQSLGAAAAAPMVQQVPVMQQPVSGQFVQQPQTQAPVQPMAQQGYVQQQPVSGQFGQQTQAPVQPMTHQGSIQQQPVPASASMFPQQQQQQNPPAPPPPVPPGYGGLQ